MNMREQMARAMHERFATELQRTSGSTTQVRPWDSDKKAHALYFAQTDAALEALSGDPGHDVTAAFLKPGEDRSAALRIWNAMITAIREGA